MPFGIAAQLVTFKPSIVASVLSSVRIASPYPPVRDPFNGRMAKSRHPGCAGTRLLANWLVFPGQAWFTGCRSVQSRGLNKRFASVCCHAAPLVVAGGLQQFSIERLNRHLGATQQDIAKAIELYEYNVHPSEALRPSAWY